MITVDENQLAVMRERGGTWACYENKALDSADAGRCIYIKYGEDCTFKVPPTPAPDGPYGLGWKYILVGPVDLEKGTVG